MDIVTWLLTIGAKIIGMSANTLLSLIGTGSLVAFLNVVMGLFGSGALEGNALLMAYLGFFVALADFIPKVIAAIPNDGNVATAADSGIADAMRIFPRFE